MKRKRFLAILLVLAMAAALLAGCGSGSGTDEIEGETESTSAETETEAEAETEAADAEDETESSSLGIEYAAGFSIEYMDDSVKLVTDYEGNKLLLVPEGSEAPDGYDDATLITTPVSNVMYDSTTYVGFLDELDDDSVYDSIGILTTDESEWTTQAIIDRFENGQITYLAQSESGASNIEDIVAINPQIVFSDGTSSTAIEQRAQLDEVGIPHVAVAEGNELDNYALVEYIKLFAAFYNLDEEAEEIFEEKCARLDELYAEMADIPEDERPTVAYGNVWDGTVYTLGEGSRMVNDIEAAGANYAITEEGYSLTYDMEAFLDQCRDADILIYPSLPQYMMGTTMEDEDPLFAEFKAVQNNQVYILDKGYYMNAAKVVEKVEDLVAICHPELMEDHEFVMFQKFDTGY